MDTPITRAEHEEFRRTMDSEHKRISRRLDTLEETTKQIGSLVLSVERLAVSMENRVISWKRWKTGTESCGAR